MFRLCRESVPGDDIYSYQHSLLFANEDTSLDFPNLFITIAPAEEKFPKHDAIFGGYSTPEARGDAAGLLCLHFDTGVSTLLLPVLRPDVGDNFEWALRKEMQGRGAIHWRLAMRAGLLPGMPVEGRTGEAHDSVLGKMVKPWPSRLSAW